MEGVLTEIVDGVAVVVAIAEVSLTIRHASRTVLPVPREEARLLLVRVVETERETMDECGDGRVVERDAARPARCVVVGLHPLDIGDRNPRLAEWPGGRGTARIAVHRVAQQRR